MQDDPNAVTRLDHLMRTLCHGEAKTICPLSGSKKHGVAEGSVRRHRPEFVESWQPACCEKVGAGTSFSREDKNRYW
jgi:hypothetical protein